MKRFIQIGVIALVPSLLLIGAGCKNQATINANESTDELAETTDVISADDYEIEIVVADVYGQDLDLVERYPDSIRSYYSSNQYETDATYQTTEDQETIRGFYNDKLTTAGWTNSEEATDYMEYTRGDEDNPEILTLYLTEYKKQGIVEYELVYEPALSDAELEDIEDEE